MTEPTPKPAEPSNAGSQTPATAPPIWTDDYDLSDQPNQEATEPPTPPEPVLETAAPQQKQPKRRRPRKAQG